MRTARGISCGVLALDGDCRFYMGAFEWEDATTLGTPGGMALPGVGLQHF
jgi:hypothetical protein